MIKFFNYVILTIALISCETKSRYGDLSTYSKKRPQNLHVVVEVTAGTNKFYEYDYQADGFKIQKLNGKDVLVKYLAAPFNIGFIPSTTVHEGKFHPIDVVLISEQYTPTTLVETKPIGAFVVKENGVERSYIITIPAEKEIRVVDVANYNDLITRYTNITDVIKIWFTSYDNTKKIEFVGFKDENYALELINKFKIKRN
jgi:inorganic pyrophosphatase